MDVFVVPLHSLSSQLAQFSTDVVVVPVRSL